MSATRTIITVVSALGCLLCSCDTTVVDDGWWPSSHYAIPAVPFPEDNLSTPERVALGRALFHDVRLSADASTSCASCHQESSAFASTTVMNAGAFGRPGKANVPSITYAAFEPRLLRGNTVPTLEMQVLVPIQEQHEFAENILAVVRKLSTDTTYQAMSRRAYGRDLDPWVLTRAISAFERTLPRFSSVFDSVTVYAKPQRLTESQKRGWTVFEGRGQCTSCHSGVLLTNHELIKVGNSGRFLDEHGMEQLDSIRVPSLRNIALTYPYMHDGSVSTLIDVLKGYQHHQHPHIVAEERFASVVLTDHDVADLLQFLSLLTDAH